MLHVLSRCFPLSSKFNSMALEALFIEQKLYSLSTHTPVLLGAQVFQAWIKKLFAFEMFFEL